MKQHALSLFELNSLVGEVIDAAFDHAYWVEAELSEAREVRGHCYLELVQKDLFPLPPWHGLPLNAGGRHGCDSNRSLSTPRVVRCMRV